MHSRFAMSDMITTFKCAGCGRRFATHQLYGHGEDATVCSRTCFHLALQQRRAQPLLPLDLEAVHAMAFPTPQQERTPHAPPLRHQ